MAFYFLSVHPTFMGTILRIPIKQNGILSSGPYVLQTLAGWSVCWLSLWLTRTKRAPVDSLRKGCNTLSCSVFALGLLGIYFAGCDTLWSEVSLFVAMGSVGFGFAGSLITAVDMSPTFCGPLMGFASTVGSLAGFIIPVIVGTLTNAEQNMTQWKLVFLISAGVGAGSGLLFQIFGSANVQPWDPVSRSQRDVEKKKNSKLKIFASNN
ncbi:putative inorganic phosphate cotransporter [Uloborus diversus]|uniref:putative inorganic phosphate cotransporter n=1 Tax=Uloborus diversus TaxID=327109 RepID=UPI0024095784|nr:putative inorganic phosphate cotransporter [Uloborus diversus]